MNIFGSYFGILEFLFYFLLILFILTQISWWLFNRYFPSINLCVVVHRNSHRWLANERKVLQHLETPSVFGFLSAALLVALIPLNVTILAQVFELFVPEGDMITFPFIGTYGTFPLLVGLLFALTEVAFSGLSELKRKTQQKTFFINVIIGIMIFVEAGLNFYRTWIMEGDEAIMATFWDKMIGFGGPVLAAFIGVVVPLAMVLLGAYALIEFIMPMVKNIVLITRFVLSHAAIYLLILLFGFHNQKPINIPAPVVRLRSEVTRIKELAAKMVQAISALKNLYPNVKNNSPQDPAVLESELSYLTQRITELEELVPCCSGDDSSLNSIKNKRSLRSTILDTKHSIRDFKADFAAIGQDLEKLDETALLRKSSFKSWQEKAEDFEKAYESAEQETTKVLKHFSQSGLQLFCDSIESALNIRMKKDSCLSEREIKDLTELVDPPANLTKDEKEWRKSTANNAKAIVQVCKSDLFQVQNDLEECRNWLSNHKPEKRSEEYKTIGQRLDAIEQKLNNLDIRSAKTQNDTKDQFNELQTKLRELALHTHAFFIWMGLLYPLHKRV